MTNERSQTAFSVLIAKAHQGDDAAVRELFSLVYAQLKQTARAQRRRRPDDSLNTTALVHEAFVKLAQQRQFGAHDRSHFMAVAATAMRQILIDHARARLAAKRGAGDTPVPLQAIEAALDGGSSFDDGKAGALLALDRSLDRLAAHSPRQSRVVDCRFFAGLSIEETAAALGTSAATVKRDWAMARAWLYRDLGEEV